VESPAIPALRDILERATGRVAVNLELKETGFEPDAIALGRESSALTVWSWPRSSTPRLPPRAGRPRTSRPA
jgi:hypothetical protein